MRNKKKSKWHLVRYMCRTVHFESKACCTKERGHTSVQSTSSIEFFKRTEYKICIQSTTLQLYRLNLLFFWDKYKWNVIQARSKQRIVY